MSNTFVPMTASVSWRSMTGTHPAEAYVHPVPTTPSLDTSTTTTVVSDHANVPSPSAPSVGTRYVEERRDDTCEESECTLSRFSTSLFGVDADPEGCDATKTAMQQHYPHEVDLNTADLSFCSGRVNVAEWLEQPVDG